MVYPGLNPVVDTNGKYLIKTFEAYEDRYNPSVLLSGDSKMPPTFIAYCSADTVVPLQTVQLFQERLEAKGGDIELKVFQGKKHGFFLSK